LVQSESLMSYIIGFIKHGEKCYEAVGNPYELSSVTYESN
jgi:hypothetical protein